jgi:hypothetical protein
VILFLSGLQYVPVRGPSVSGVFGNALGSSADSFLNGNGSTGRRGDEGETGLPHVEDRYLGTLLVYVETIPLPSPSIIPRASSYKRENSGLLID